jgi:DNA excision repair protein ERCC-4
VRNDDGRLCPVVAGDGALVVEATLADVSRGKYRCDMKPHAALQSIIAFMVRYQVPVILAGDRKGGEYIVYWLLAKYLREIEERHKQATRWQEEKK